VIFIPIKISNRFVALENLDEGDLDINRAWENVTENLKASTTESLGYYELKQNNP
jgi:hypothetical protein